MSVELDGVNNILKTDTISEVTSANGVTIDGVNIKDSKIVTANSVDSDVYVDGSIDTAHIAADQIVASLIADDAINSEHYTDGSIDTAHIGATQVTGAKLNNDVISAQTALAEQPASDDEIMISDGGTLKRLDFDHIYSTPSFYAYQASTQAIGNGSLTKVTLGTEGWDTDSAFTGSAWTPGVIGKYYIAGAAFMAGMTTNAYAELKFYKNGSQIPGRNGNLRVMMSSTAAANMSITSSFIIELDADDYIEMYIIQDNADGGGGSRTLGDANNLAYMSGFKIVGI